MSTLFHPKPLIGCYAFLTLFKAIIGYCDLSPSKAIIRCRVPPSKAIIRCRVFFHPKPVLDVMSFSLYSKPLLDVLSSVLYQSIYNKFLISSSFQQFSQSLSCIIHHSKKNMSKKIAFIAFSLYFIHSIPIASHGKILGF